MHGPLSVKFMLRNFIVTKHAHHKHEKSSTDKQCISCNVDRNVGSSCHFYKDRLFSVVTVT